MNESDKMQAALLVLTCNLLHSINLGPAAQIVSVGIMDDMEKVIPACEGTDIANRVKLILAKVSSVREGRLDEEDYLAACQEIEIFRLFYPSFDGKVVLAIDSLPVLAESLRKYALMMVIIEERQCTRAINN